jgi:hypothetical protein
MIALNTSTSDDLSLKQFQKNCFAALHLLVLVFSLGLNEASLNLNVA